MVFLSVGFSNRLVALLVLVALAASSAAHAATITVTTTADPGTMSDCSLRAAMTAAVSLTATDACPAGTGDDSIVFQAGVTGTILLESILPLVTKGKLTITGPGGSPGIVIDASKAVTAFGVKSAGALTLAKLTIVNATDSAVVNSGAKLTVDHCTLSDNTATSTGGGAIFATGGASATTRITESTFSGNSSTTPGVDEIGGGAILIGSPPDSPGTLIITGSTFHNNHCARDGGAILSLDSIVTIVNSTFASNSAEIGGGAIWDTESIVSITNSTFSTNTVTGGQGGAIHNFKKEMSLRGTILSGEGEGGNCFGTITDAGYNLSDDDSCGFSATGSKNNTDPKLDPAGLKDNGGPTQTIALTVGSPAVDAIPLISCTDQSTPTPKQLKTDQRGVTRPDPEDIASPACDIGAYELVECTGAFASIPTVFPPNHKFVSESVLGPTGVNITGIFQDEPVANDATCPDATGVGGSTAKVRAERDGSGNGRVYHIQFTATDTAIGSACLGEVTVCVPHDRGHPTCKDGGALYDSTMCGR